jgi:16S rRNA (guanine(966)-N(2))-methyltransferase RsmD
MRTQVRIVAGTLRGRKLSCTVGPNLRPTPQMVREALFSLLGDAVPGRAFYDIFAGTGVVGMEAISRGAESATLVERDFRLLADLDRHLKEFGIADRAQVVRSDVYRWAERWQPPPRPVTLFLSPPFADFQRRPEAVTELLRLLQQKAAPGSVIVLQGEHDVPIDLPQAPEWEDRRYGRNHLFVWVKAAQPPTNAEENGKRPVTTEDTENTEKRE